MSALGRYIVDAVVLEHRSPSELARDHKISRSWIYELLERFQKGGYEALTPRSRRPPDHPLSPGQEGHQSALGRHRLAGPQAQGPDNPPAPQATTLILRSLRGPAAQRNLAGRRHPVAARRWHLGRDLEPARGLLPGRPGFQLLPDRQGSRRGPSLLFSFESVRFAGLPADRQRPHLHRPLHRRQGLAGVRARAPRHRLQALHALSPLDRAAMEAACDPGGLQ